MPPKRTTITIDSFEELVAYLLNWRSFGDPVVYDGVGMMELFCACIANMRRFSNDESITELGDSLTDDEKAFLLGLASGSRDR